MSGGWDLTDPRQAEEAMNYYFSLPDEENDSDVEADPDAAEEYAALSVEREHSLSFQSVQESDVGEQLEVDTANCEISVPENVDQFENLDIQKEEEEEEDVDVDSVWSHDSTYFDTLSKNFDQDPKVNLPLKSADKEIIYFKALLGDDILTLIVDQTNLYAQQKGGKNWTPLSVKELEAYLGCLILMGIHSVPHLANYWSSDPYLHVACVANVMPSKRFLKITQYLHCNNNELCPPKGDPDYDKLYKLRPVIDNLNKKCQDVYTCSSALSVDESMIAFKGRCTLKQYLPMKPIKRGYKVWCIADSKTGFISKFDIYTGKSGDNRSNNLGEKVVLHLTSHFNRSQRLVVFDNYFTSIFLVRELYKNGIYSVGTVRNNRKGLPSMMKQNNHMSRGEFMFESKGVVSAIKWQDSKPVTLLSSAVSPKDTSNVQRKNKDGSRVTVSCPKAVSIYNSLMGGVDKFDQLKERYAIGRRSLKWWHRIFYFLIDMAIVNAFTMYKITKRLQLEQLTFRINLARQLISGFSSRKRRGKPTSFLANKRMVPEEVRLTSVGCHFLEDKSKYRRCRMCSTKKVEKRTKYICSACDVPLCIKPCFKQFHGK